MSDEIANTSNKTEPHIVIGLDRIIKVPDELKKIAIQYDHNVETVTFDCPRYWDGLDMSDWDICINYVRSDKEKGIGLVDNVVVDSDNDNIIHFDWTISNHVTMTAGVLQFLVNIKKVDNEGNTINNWNSAINNEMKVLTGINGDEAFNDDRWYQYANKGKDTISKAITGVDEDIVIPNDATFEQLAECIGKISTGMKIANGEMSILTIPDKIEGETPFKPKIVIVYNFGSGLANFNMGVYVSPDIIENNQLPVTDSANGIGGKLSRRANAFTIYDTGFEMLNTGAATNLKWFAFGY